MIFKIKLCGKIIEIKSLYSMVYEQCLEYLTDEAPADISIEITQVDIAFEKQKTKEELSEGNFEVSAVHRKICLSLIDDDIFLMHGSVVAVGNSAYMFTAPSGTGKTTHTRIWLKNIEGSFVVNGDKPLLYVGDEVLAFGTPWCGKEKMQAKVSVPLKAIVILERAKENEIKEINFMEAFPVLLSQSFRGNDKTHLAKTISLINKVSSKVKFYRLKCNMDDEAAVTAYKGLSPI